MYQTLRRWDALELRGKRVLLRLDLDVAVENGEPTDSARLEAAVASVRALQAKGAQTIVLAHRGRPTGVDRALSLEPVARFLAARLPKGTTRFAPMDDYEALRAETLAMAQGDVLVLENLRFHPAEEANDAAFARQLADLGDAYVNDAFATSHREHASMVGVPSLMASAAGPCLLRELEALEPVRHPARHPYVAIVGGAKIASKVEALEAVLRQAETVFVGGAIASLFFKAKGLGVGRSFVEDGDLAVASRLQASPVLQLPEDIVVSNTRGEYRATTPDDARDDETIVDIGVRSVENIARALATATLVLWNGPVGRIEDPRARAGSDAIAHLTARRARGQAYVVVGGGNTIDVIEALGIADFYDHVSTGGGAMLKYVGGGSLPALDVLCT